LEARYGPAKIGEQRRSCLAAQRAAGIFGWRPQVSLREGLERTIAYYRGKVAS
jgi:UDP-glucose 4-epimerase